MFTDQHSAMCPQKYGIWSQRLAGSQSSPSCSTHSSNVWKKHNVICRLKTSMIRQRKSREMYKNTAKLDPDIPGGPSSHTKLLLTYTRSFYHPRSDLPGCTKSPFHRLSVNHYHEIPRFFKTLAKTAIFPKLSRPGMRHFSFPQL